MLPAGYTSRCAQFDDIPSIVRMLNQTDSSQSSPTYFTDDLQTEWTTPGFKPENSIRLVFSRARKLVGYIEVWDIDDPPVRPTVWGRIHPDYTRQGIGTHLMEWAETRLKQVIPRCPKNLRIAYQCGCDNHHIGTQVLFKRFGLQYYRDSWDMEINLTQEPPPPTIASDFIIRPYQHPDEFEHIVLANEEAFEDHYGYVKKTPEQHLEQWHHLISTDPYFDPSVWFIAEHIASSEIAGVAISRPRAWNHPNKAYLGSLSVRQPYRRRGLASALLQHTFRAFWLRGISMITLSVDAKNLTGATHLYEKAGMYITRHLMLYEKELRHGIEYSITE